MYLERDAQGLREHICKVRQHYQLKGYNALKIHKCPCLQHSLCTSVQFCAANPWSPKSQGILLLKHYTFVFLH